MTIKEEIQIEEYKRAFAEAYKQGFIDAMSVYKTELLTERSGVLFKGRLEEGKYNLIKTTDGWVLDGENIAYAGFDICR